jgi:hypothetical protein
MTIHVKAPPFLLLLAIVLLALPAFGQAEVRRALVIGVKDYPHYPEEKRLKYADSDARGFSELLDGAPAGQFKVTPLLNEHATREEILSKLDDIRRERDRIDTLFVFFSGHGEKDPSTQSLYLMPYDGDPNRLWTGILDSEFLDRVRAIGARSVVVFLDACHSGSALGKGGEANIDLAEHYGKMFTGSNQGRHGIFTLFASAGAAEKSYEDDDYRQGIFTHFLIKGLAGDADIGPRDGRVTMGKLKVFLEREVRARSLAITRSEQTVFVGSQDYDANFVLTFSMPPSRDRRVTAVDETIAAQIGRLRNSDPELALMVHVGAINAGLNPFGPSEAVMEGALRQTLDQARIRKVASPKSSVKPEDLISATISVDGSLLVACAENPLRLLAFRLDTGDVAKESPLTLYGAGGRRPAAFDGCNISVSRDNRFAVVQVKQTDGTSSLSLRALGAVEVPNLSVSTYEFAAFAGDFLVVVKAGALSFLSTDTWSQFGNPTQLSAPIESLTYDSGSSIVASHREGTVKLYYADRGDHSITSQPIVSSPSFDRCSVTNELAFCQRQGKWSAFRPGDGGGLGGEGGCGGLGCKFFPSTSNSLQAGGWSIMFQDLSDPSTLLFVDVRSRSAQSIRVPEPVIVARLLSGGGVIVLGRQGGIYRFNSIGHVDCCSVPTPWGSGAAHVAAGNSGDLVALRDESGQGYFVAYDMNNTSVQIPMSDSSSVRQMIWAESNKTLALASDDRIRLMDMEDITAKPVVLDCTFPAAFDAAGTLIACVDPVNRDIQVRATSDGTVKRRFTDHAGPLHSLLFTSRTLVAAGTSSGLSRTFLTAWDSADGRLISQRTCDFQKTPGLKPIALLRGSSGATVIELDTPSRMVGGDAQTCESRISSNLGSGATSVASSPVAGTAVFWTPKANLLYMFNAAAPEATYQLRSDLPVDDLSVSPDGRDIMLLAGGRILRIPITLAGLLDAARRMISRELSDRECQQFFPFRSCPKLREQAIKK